MMNTRKSLDQFRKEIKKEVKAKTIEMASKGFKRLVHLSPYKYGSYILSHRIGVNKISGSVTSMPDLYKMSDGEKKDANKIGKSAAMIKARKNQLPKLAKVKAFDDVYLTNNIPHGALIEYGSWSKQAPAGVYGLVHLELAGMK